MKTLLAIFCLLLCATACLHAQPGKLILVRQSISASGAGLSTSPTRMLHSSLGEPFVGISRSATRILHSGFLFVRQSQGPTEITRLPISPTAVKLHQNYPNPVSLSNGYLTTMVYEIDEAADVHLQVYNALGQKVATVVHGRQSAGVYSTTFNVASLPAGVYFTVLRVSTPLGMTMRRISMLVVR